MLGWSLNFLILALVSAGLGTAEVTTAAATLAKVLFGGSALLFVSTLIRAGRRRPTI